MWMFLATPLVASHSVKGTGAFSEAPVLFAFGAFGAETLAPSGGPGVFFRFCYSMWLFHLHSAVKIQPFSPVFPLAGTADKAFVGYPFGTLKRNVSTIFYDTAKSFSPMPLHERRLCHGMWLFCIYGIVNIRFLSDVSLANPITTNYGILLSISLKLQERKHQSFVVAQPKRKILSSHLADIILGWFYGIF